MLGLSCVKRGRKYFDFEEKTRGEKIDFVFFSAEISWLLSRIGSL